MNNAIYTDGSRVVRRAEAVHPTKGGAHAFFEVAANDGKALDLLCFQHDTIPAVGVQGWTNEAVLAVVIDRLRGFQAGAFGCRENALALTKCEEALLWLEKRTADRRARNVEGKHET